MEKIRQYALPLGRIFIAQIFILAGLHKITAWEGTAGYMASQGLPMVPVLLFLTIVVELGGGLLLLVGWKTEYAAALLFLFLIPVTFTFHAFWTYDDPGAAQNQMINFQKNLAIMGGLAYVFVYGAVSGSVDKILKSKSA